jgi:hypothetical protein
MKIAKSNRKARITEQEVNTALYVSSDSDNNYYYYQPYKDLPILYEIAVQVRILGFWFTIWSASVEISDGDGRAIIQKRASEIIELLEGIL